MPGNEITITDIANMALGACGARDTITNFSERSNEANAVRLYFDSTRDALLRGAQWNFSRRQDYLTLLKAANGTPENPAPGPANGMWNPLTMPPIPWLYSYLVPGDSVRVWSILPTIQAIEAGGSVPVFSVATTTPTPLSWRRGVRFVEGLDRSTTQDYQRCIFTNAENAIAVYGWRVLNPALWDSQFVTAMIGSLAWRLCIPISGDKKLAQMARESAIEAVMAARVSDGNEGSTNVNQIPDWIAVRGFAGDYMTDDNGNGPDAYCAGWDAISFLGI